jgi:hypothetical protein
MHTDARSAQETEAGFPLASFRKNQLRSVAFVLM